MWRRLHRWIGLSLAVALVPIAVTGSLLVWREHVDALLSPELFAVSASEMRQPLARYLDAAATQTGAEYAAVALRFPQADGWPVRVVMRKTDLKDREDLARELIVYLDPPTAAVLGVANPRTSFTGTIRRLHRDLLVPDWSGRQIVGWVGAGMLALTLSGLWLWWPRGRFLAGMRWRRSPRTSLNLHYFSGFWIALPLAVVSATGIYLSFPQTARSLTAAFADPAPLAMRADRNSRVTARLSIDEAATFVKTEYPQARTISILLPLRYRSSRGDSEPRIFWHFHLSDSQEAGRSFLLDDASGELAALPEPGGAQRVIRVVHRLHEGHGYGAIWSIAVFLSGVVPAVLAVTGLLMWLRTRHRRTGSAASIPAPSPEVREPERKAS